MRLAAHLTAEALLDVARPNRSATIALIAGAARAREALGGEVPHFAAAPTRAHLHGEHRATPQAMRGNQLAGRRRLLHEMAGPVVIADRLGILKTAARDRDGDGIYGSKRAFRRSSKPG